MERVRFNLCCSECGKTNTWGSLEPSRIRFCPFCKKKTEHCHNDSYVISENELKTKIDLMIKENEEKENDESKRN